MCQPKKWWWGLLPLALLFALMASLTGGPVEGDLARRSADVFKGAGLSWAKSGISGRDAVVSGEAPNAESQKLALAAAERAWGVRQVANATTVVADIKPYTAAATRAGATITLTGFVPNDAARAALVAAAKTSFAGATVVDQLKDGPGAPAVYAPAMAFGLAQLGKLTSGVASFQDGALTVTGVAPDVPAYDGVLAALKGALPAGVTLASQDIKGPAPLSPYVWSATRAQGVTTLAGAVPSETIRGAVVESARKAFPTDRVVDQMKLALGAPAGFMDAVNASLAQLGKLASGAVTLTNTAIKLTGDAANAALADQIKAGLTGAALPAGFTGDVGLAVPAPPAPVAVAPPLSIAPPNLPQVQAVIPPAAPQPAIAPPVAAAARAPTANEICQIKFREILDKDSIHFATGSARITGESQGVVKALADATKACPTMTVEIQGHTDSDGDPAANLDLSNKRADAVVKALEALGVEEGKLSARGYGQTQPVAANDTAENKAKNRRIDFVVAK